MINYNIIPQVIYKCEMRENARHVQNIIVEIPELNSTENKSKRDKLSEHVPSLT